MQTHLSVREELDENELLHGVELHGADAWTRSTDALQSFRQPTAPVCFLGTTHSFQHVHRPCVILEKRRDHASEVVVKQVILVAQREGLRARQVSDMSTVSAGVFLTLGSTSVMDSERTSRACS